MEEKLITVIVPLYNCEKYVKECVESILDNTYRNLEVIVVNDGSTDRSLEIINSIKDERLKVVSQDNGGLSSARNAGLYLASGDYISFIDADDVVAPNFYEKLVDTINGSPTTDIAECKIAKFYTEVAPVLGEMKGMITTASTLSDKLSHLKMYPYDGIMQMNKLYKKKVFESIRYPEGLIHEDEYVIYEEMKNCRKIAYLDMELYGYRCGREGSITNVRTEKNLKGMIDARRHVIAETSKDCASKTINLATEKEWINFELTKLLNDTMYMYATLPKTTVTKECYQGAKQLYKDYKQYLTHKTKYVLFFACPDIVCTAIKKKKR